MPITLSGKKYMLKRQVYKCMVMAFSIKISIPILVLTSYGFVLSYMCFMHLTLLNHSTPDYTWHAQSVA